MSAPSLCVICKIQPHKYCCPQCPGQIRTCSLPCYKRHQQRASCTGKRNPAAYLKKSQLVTPLAIDRDYNFIAGVEQALDRGAHRTSGLVPHGRDHSRPNGRFFQYLHENKILVDTAPPGLDRHKCNQSRYLPKSKKVIWSVEWCDLAGTLATVEASEEITIADCHAQSVKSRARSQAKRKREATSEDTIKSRGRAVGSERATISAEKHQEATSHAVQNGEAQVAPTPDVQSPIELRYYLLRPKTKHQDRVLILVSPRATLTECLRDQTVLEYPTFYAFAADSDDLPVGFISETAYLAQCKDTEDAPIRDTMRNPPSSHRRRASSVAAEAPLDQAAILDMLKRDTVQL